LKVKSTAMQKLFGVLIGLLMAYATFFSAFSSMLYSPSFYLKQDSRYQITERAELKNADEYRKIYTAVIDALKHGTEEAQKAVVVKKGYAEDFSDTVFSLGSFTLTKEWQQFSSEVTLDEKYFETLNKLYDYGYDEAYTLFVKFLNAAAEETASYLLDDFTVERIDGQGALLLAASDAEEETLTGWRVFSRGDGNVTKAGEGRNGSSGAVLFAPDSAQSVLAFASGESLKELVAEGGTVRCRVSFFACLPQEAEAESAEIAVQFASGKESTAVSAAEEVGGEHRPMFGLHELARLEKGHRLLFIGNILRWTALGLALALVILILVKDRRPGLRGVGIASLVTVLILFLLLDGFVLVCMSRSAQVQQALYGLLGSAPMDGEFLPFVLGANYANDFIKGFLSFFSFIMCIPVAASFLLLRLSAKRDDFANDDYMYQ